MAVALKNSYRFALRSSLFVAILLTLVVAGLLYISGVFVWYIPVAFLFLSFLFSFLIIQSRVERFIYRRVKKIYDDVSLLESTSFSSKPITTDMKTLTEEIEKFARDKKVEIDTLKIREEYRRDFLGNVSHELKTPLFTVQGYILTLLDGAIKDKKVSVDEFKKIVEKANK